MRLVASIHNPLDDSWSAAAHLVGYAFCPSYRRHSDQITRSKAGTLLMADRVASSEGLRAATVGEAQHKHLMGRQVWMTAETRT
jgi:hypothetical protein